MQRKLSAIAEIPKILSSTLATVSQSFGNLDALDTLETEAVYKRKCSYDEDALDYELLQQPESECDSEGDEEEEDDLVQVQGDDANDLAVKQYKSKALKDATPESDYASEANYAANEMSDEPDDEDEDEDGDEDEHGEEEIYYIKLPAMPAGGDFSEETAADAVNISSEEDDDDDDDDDDVDVDEADNESDFLSTTYTWNLRNVPKLRINDAEGTCNLTLSPQLELEQHNAIDTSKVRAATPTPKSTRTSTTQLSMEAPPTTTTTPTTPAADAQSQKLLFKLDNLERSWPWADREKIIYKQSTCHLVSRKPLGLVGQRIQLLANQELLRKDKDKAQ